MSELPNSQPDLEQPAETPASETAEPTRPTGPILTSGDLQFQLMTPEGVSEQRVDLLWLKLTCEEAERENELRTDTEGRMLPSAQFLDDLAARLSAKVPTCTPTMAYQMWIAASHAMTELKNAMSGMPN
jgi:hypothetical protein